MEADVRKRIQEILSQRQITVNSLATWAGTNQSKLSKQINGKTAISVSTILMVLERIPELSAEWLLRGDGEIEKSPTAPKENYPQGKNITERLVSLLESQLEDMRSEKNKLLNIISEQEKRRSEYQHRITSDTPALYTSESGENDSLSFSDPVSALNCSQKEDRADAQERKDSANVTITKSKINGINVL